MKKKEGKNKGGAVQGARGEYATMAASQEGGKGKTKIPGSK